ncbi:MAG: 4-(cytidine 5'-diphospho)-2-C-methyl-D-erythritol kinase [Acidimicrobiia bacterium]
MEYEALQIEAAAKINLSLRVKALDSSGLHPLLSLVQSFDRCDRLTASLAGEDELDIGDVDLPTGRENLIWRAIDRLRAETGDQRSFSFSLTKQIPIAAGLAGGSADAAAALEAAAALLGISRATILDVAAGVGADVPFCVQGGFSWMEGHGERLTPIRQALDDYALAVVVPPFALNTSAVYRRWDEMGEPAGGAVDARHLPPSLRTFGPFVNDLYLAALDLRPELGDWQAELVSRWERPVMLSGSGPSLFAYFEDRTEATEATGLGPTEARARFATSPVAFGVRPLDSLAEDRSH